MAPAPRAHEAYIVVQTLHVVDWFILEKGRVFWRYGGCVVWEKVGREGEDRKGIPWSFLLFFLLFCLALLFSLSL